MHVQVPRQFGGLIGEVAALTPVPVDLLQAHDVGAGVTDLGRDAVEIQAVIDALAVLDVVGHDADRPVRGSWLGEGGRRRAGRQDADGRRSARRGRAEVHETSRESGVGLHHAPKCAR